ncbi:hypothetical protein [Delftia sp. GW456-R20]|uniref:hypothetical protein n=1 Tax=Delftia sp. GW456-R20 TaxID=1827145 RepID=UPI0018D32620|nr:hypothetical protein [Delftia sp. GW456-R20]
MSVDPRLVEIARAVQRERGLVPKSASVLAPVRMLIAECVSLGMARTDIFEFVQRAEINISYGGLCVWIQRQYGSGNVAAQAAGKEVQRAVDKGIFESPYFSREAEAAPESSQVSPPRNRVTKPKNPGAQEISGDNSPVDAAALVEKAKTTEYVATSSAVTASSSTARPTSTSEQSASREVVPAQGAAPVKHLQPAEESEAEREKKKRLEILSKGITSYQSPFKRLSGKGTPEK